MSWGKHGEIRRLDKGPEEDLRRGIKGITMRLKGSSSASAASNDKPTAWRRQMLKDVEFVRTNGFDRINSQQVAAWFFILLFLFLHNAMVLNIRPENWRLAALVAGNFLFLLVIVLLVVCTYMDPADPSVRSTRRQGQRRRRSRLDLDRSTQPRVIDDNNVCFFCEVQVSTKAKHCGACNKCVSDFDHHCVWLNNCVGGRTYRLFVTLLCSAVLGSIVLIATAVGIIVLRYEMRNGLVANTHVFGRSTPVTTVVVLAGVMIALAMIAFALLAHLLYFHCYLIWHGLSTYDFVMLLRDKERPKVERKGHRPKGRRRCAYVLRKCGCISRAKDARVAPAPLPVTMADSADNMADSADNTSNASDILPAGVIVDAWDPTTTAGCADEHSDHHRAGTVGEGETEHLSQRSITPPHGTIEPVHTVVSDTKFGTADDPGTIGSSGAGVLTPIKALTDAGKMDSPLNRRPLPPVPIMTRMDMSPDLSETAV